MKCGLKFGGDDARPGPGAPTTRRHTDTRLCVEVYGKEGAPCPGVGTRAYIPHIPVLASGMDTAAPSTAVMSESRVQAHRSELFAELKLS
jgi:hypothetical protein